MFGTAKSRLEFFIAPDLHRKTRLEFFIGSNLLKSTKGHYLRTTFILAKSKCTKKNTNDSHIPIILRDVI